MFLTTYHAHNIHAVDRLFKWNILLQQQKGVFFMFIIVCHPYGTGLLQSHNMTTSVLFQPFPLKTSLPYLLINIQMVFYQNKVVLYVEDNSYLNSIWELAKTTTSSPSHKNKTVDMQGPLKILFVFFFCFFFFGNTLQRLQESRFTMPRKLNFSPGNDP